MSIRVPNLVFKSVVHDPSLITFVTQQFCKVIQPLYGDQIAAINKIKNANDRSCLVLHDSSDPKGIVVYKTAPEKSAVFKDSKGRDVLVRDSIEIKTLFVVSSSKNSGRGYGSLLLDQVFRAAKAARASAVHVTVASVKEDSKRFFEHKGFRLVGSQPDMYKKNITEHLFVKHLDQHTIHTPTVPILGASHASIPSRKPSHYCISLKNFYLQYISQGKKSVEGRINHGQFAKMAAGDSIEFFNGSSRVFVRVLQVQKFDSFEEMLKATGIKKMLPDMQDSQLEDAVRLYRSFPRYTEKEQRYGVVAIHIQVDDSIKEQRRNLVPRDRYHGHKRHRPSFAKFNVNSVEKRRRR